MRFPSLSQNNVNYLSDTTAFRMDKVCGLGISCSCTAIIVDGQKPRVVTLNADIA